ncbi:MAG TPA: glycoside hydrolase family 16 protein, partial [Thermomicrobiales bacterium]|nr:glycoside hydrolase family 16 protein [Thermomicrobiales bacterium]
MPTFDRDIDILEFDEQFDNATLNPERWVDHFVPHWTTPDRSAARYDLADGVLRLRIDADQPAWRVEEGELRASSIQSGTWSGPAGSGIGLHRHGPGHLVRTPQSRLALYTPNGGAVEADLKASRDATTMVAFYLVGFEDASPDHAGEICVVEIFGNAIGDRETTINTGIKAHHDPNLVDDMATLSLPINGSDWHTYGTEWDEREVRLLVDGTVIRTIPQGFSYPMLLLVSLFEFPPDAPR